eukprot:5748819-Amphidinium_carterae.1
MLPAVLMSEFRTAIIAQYRKQLDSKHKTFDQYYQKLVFKEKRVARESAWRNALGELARTTSSGSLLVLLQKSGNYAEAAAPIPSFGAH